MFNILCLQAAILLMTVTTFAQSQVWDEYEAINSAVRSLHEGAEIDVVCEKMKKSSDESLHKLLPIILNMVEEDANQWSDLDIFRVKLVIAEKADAELTEALMRLAVLAKKADYYEQAAELSKLVSKRKIELANAISSPVRRSVRVAVAMTSDETYTPLNSLQNLCLESITHGSDCKSQMVLLAKRTLELSGRIAKSCKK